MDDKLSKIYQYLSSQNVENLPKDFSGFESLMDDDAKAQKVHQFLLSQNVENVDPDFNKFSDYIGRKKKEPTQPFEQTQEILSKNISVKPEEFSQESLTPLQPSPSVDINTKINDLLTKSPEPHNPLIQASDASKVSTLTKPLQIPTLRSYLNKTQVQPSDLGLSDNINLDRNLRPGEEEAFNAIIKRKGLELPKPSYFWGAGAEIGKAFGTVFHDLDDAAKVLSNATGLKHGGLFGDIGNWFDAQAEQIRPMPQTHVGKLLSGAIGLEPLFIEMGITPEFKFKALGKVREIPKLITQMAGKGFVNKYASNINRDNTPEGKELWEGVKGAGGGAFDAAIFTALGYAGGKTARVIANATKSGVAGGLTNAVINGGGFAGYDLMRQVMSGQPIDWDQVQQSAELGGLLTIPQFAEFAGMRATGNYLMSSPKAKEEANNIQLSPTELRDKAFDIREEAKKQPDLQKQATHETAANVVDALADIKAVTEEVKKNPEAFTETVKNSDLPKEQKDILTKNIEDDAYPYQIGKDKFQTKEELNDFLDKNAVDKETGKLNRAFFDYKEDLWPEPKTIKAINEWTDNFKSQNKLGGQENAISTGESTQESSQQAPKLEQGEEERLRLRDNEKNRLEAVKGEEVKPESFLENPEGAPKGVKEQIKEFKQKGELQPNWEEALPTIPKKEIGTLSDGRKVFIVSGEQIRDKIYTNFTEGGNSSAYPWMEKGDIFVEDVEATKDKIADLIHEAEEQRAMDEKGWSYDKAHEEAGLPAEQKFRETGEIPDYLKEVADLLQKEPIEPLTEVTQPEIAPKEAISAPITEKPIETPLPTEVPPEPLKTGENEGNVRKILERALNSNLPEDVKQEIREKGINYVPRGRKVTDAEAQELVNVFGTDDAGLDKLQAEVFNMSNGMLADTRTTLNAIVAEKLAQRLEGVTDADQRAVIRDKLTNSIIFDAEQGTLGGQSVESKKRWGKLLGSTPELLVASVREKLDRANREYFGDKTTEVEFAKKIMEEYVNTPEFKEAVQKGIGEEIDKIGTKNWGEEANKKIDDFFNGLLIDPKQQNLYGGLLGIPVAMYNGAMLVIRDAMKLGVGLTVAVQRGVEYLDREFKNKYEKGEIDSPDWGRDEYIADTQQRLKPLIEKLPKVEKGVTKRVKKPKAPPSQQEVVDKIFEKMAKFATRKQVGDFVAKYLEELSEKGAITDPRMRAILSKALGRDYVTEQTEAKLTDAARALGNANKKTEEFAKTFQDYIDEYNKDPNSAKLTDLRDIINKSRKQAQKAQRKALEANQKIKEMLAQEPDLVDVASTLIQGNLLVPSSQIANIAGNIAIIPFNGPAYLISGMADALISQMARLTEPLKKIDPRKHPDLYHLAQMLPSTERTTLPLTYARGYLKGAWLNTLEGFRQLYSGALERDLMKTEVQRGVHPLDAAKRIWDVVTLKNKREFSKVFGDVLQALPAGYFAEAQFRLLNLGDKPFRGGAERGRLSEIFELNWRKKITDAKNITDPAEKDKRLAYLNDSKIKNIERDKFISHPDAESLTASRKQGDIATFAEATELSKWLTSLGRQFSNKKDNTTGKIGNSILRLIKATALPYVKVPINLTKLSFETSIPMIPAVKFLYHTGLPSQIMGKGEFSGNRRAAMDDLGKFVMSSAVMSVAIALARHGLITTLSDDKDVKAAQLASGKEEGRLNISGLRRLINGDDPSWQEGDKTWSIKRLAIVSVQLMAVAQAYKDKTPQEIDEMLKGNPLQQIWQTNVGMTEYVPKMALQQSILTGTNTLLQALTGGEAEKDRWMVSEAQVLSTLLYPNTVAAISQAYDPERLIRETRDLSQDKGKITRHIENSFKDRLFMGKDLPAKVSVWGDRVERIPKGENRVMYSLLGITKEKKYQKYSFGTKLYEMYEQFSQKDPEEAKKIFPTPPSPSTKVGWVDSKMTPKEFEEYQIRVGRTRAQDAEAYVNSKEWDEATMDDRMKELGSIYSNARKEAEAQMFSWNNYRQREPNNWKTMLDEDALPLPSMVKKLGDVKLTPQEVEQLNNIALSYYADDIMPYLSGVSKEELAKDKEPDPDTGKSTFIEELNKSWSRALKQAKRDMEDIVSGREQNK